MKLPLGADRDDLLSFEKHVYIATDRMQAVQQKYFPKRRLKRVRFYYNHLQLFLFHIYFVFSVLFSFLGFCSMFP